MADIQRTNRSDFIRRPSSEIARLSSRTPPPNATADHEKLTACRAEQVQPRHPEAPQRGLGFFQAGDDISAAHRRNIPGWPAVFHVARPAFAQVERRADK